MSDPKQARSKQVSKQSVMTDEHTLTHYTTHSSSTHLLIHYTTHSPLHGLLFSALDVLDGCSLHGLQLRHQLTDLVSLQQQRVEGIQLVTASYMYHATATAPPAPAVIVIVMHPIE